MRALSLSKGWRQKPNALSLSDYSRAPVNSQSAIRLRPFDLAQGYGGQVRIPHSAVHNSQIPHGKAPRRKSRAMLLQLLAQHLKADVHQMIPFRVPALAPAEGHIAGGGKGPACFCHRGRVFTSI